MYTNFCRDNGYKSKGKNPFAKEAKVAGLKKTREKSIHNIIKGYENLH